MKWVKKENFYTARGKYYYACGKTKNWVLIIGTNPYTMGINLDVKDLATAKEIVNLLEK